VTVPKADYSALLQTLVRHKVAFIVVGGVSAVLHGVPITTLDLDIVHSLESDNLRRLISAMHDLEACYRGRGDQRLLPSATTLASSGHHLLITRFGPLDVLGTIGTGRGYEDLQEHTVELQVHNFTVHVLSLEKLIEIKEETGLDKDKAVLPVLRRTLEEKMKR
jgi:hypothetical protein